MVVSSELRVGARRRDGVRGEHSAWWMKRALLPAVEVTAMLAAKAVMDIGGVVVLVG